MRQEGSLSRSVARVSASTPRSSSFLGWASRGMWLGAFLLFVAAHIWSAAGTELRVEKLLDIGRTWSFVRSQMWPPDWSYVADAVAAARQTLQISLLGTTFALAGALPLCFLAAWNTAPHPIVYGAARLFLGFLRSVPEIIWAFILVPALGLGPFPAVVSLVLHNLGVLGKTLSELVEAADQGPQEAIASTGASRIPVLLYGIVPQILPNVLSNAFYRFEVNLRATLVLGLVGAGGLGQNIFIHFKLFEYRGVTVDILAVMALVLVADYLGAWVRSRIV